MPYKVFLVEDEIVTREGIRDNVDWVSAGFEFCGEAPDGEIALPLIESTKPDVLITDIKMPFMDGLQLTKIIREHMPWIKIIILSGHDEFQYAQSAVKLGVTEYLLKPVSSRDLRKTLTELAVTLDRENQEREKLKSLQHKVEDNLLLSREKFLLKLIMGGVSSSEAIEQSQQLGLEIVAPFYLVVIIRIELCGPFDYYEYQQVGQIVSRFAGNNSDVLVAPKDMEEMVLLIKGDSLEQLVQEGNFLAQMVKNEVESQTTCNLVIEMGSPQIRLGEIHRSFAEALVRSKSGQSAATSSQIAGERVDLINIDHTAVENYLKFGSIRDFDDFFANSIEAVARTALQSSLMKHYLFVDVILAATQFVSDLGGSVELFDLNIYELENVLSQIKSMEQIKAELRKVFSAALTYRGSQVNHERILILQRAREFLDRNFADPDLQMNRVAQEFNLSPSYFSTIFRQELGETFRDHLSKVRINRAKELLRTTHLKCSEVAYQSGFNDSHYFSFIFKKKTGLTPQRFRKLSEEERQEES